MIAHVAEAGEGRGRVVLKLDACTMASDCAIEAAVKVAQAFQSELEGLVVEDIALFDLASFPFAREISLSGRVRGALAAADIEREAQLSASALLRKVEAIAARAAVPLLRRTIRDDPVYALARACAANGPWNVVALAEPLNALRAEMLERLFDTVAETTGVIVTGPRARRVTGPVIVAIEEIERLPPMLRAARRLSAADGSEIRIVLTAEDERRLLWMDGQARLVMGDASGVQLETLAAAQGPASLAERLRRMKASFVIAQYGGLVAPRGDDLRPLSAALECPLFLVR